MRGAENAKGHARERVRRCLLARPNHAGAFADDVAERPSERAEALPAGVKSDLGDRKLGITEQRGGALDSPSEQIAMRRHAEGLLERPCEVRFGHAAHAGETSHRPLLVGCGIHPVLRTQQAAQQLGFVIHEPTLILRSARTRV
jgi:hypothetical protein